ncbi:YbgF trimerization domain-containing protein [Paludibacterium denitrificans]|uniref:YbgF trimerization domain-containing protein n=1 Tax=Paludibacterium denitrificans TaxID=2675226 RepID=UPI001E4A0618|nr:YbgF trimerization domain-containing protein [Paludibacterium denitrificans]
MKRLAISSALLLLLTGCATTSDLEDTRRQIDQVNKQASSRPAEMESKLSNDKLLEMVNQLDGLKADVAKLRGDVEVLNYTVQTMQKRQNDLYNDLDGRLSQLEGSRKSAAVAVAPAQAPASNPAAGAQPGPDYDKALNLLRNRDFPKAVDALKSYIQQNPNTPEAVDATYWLGVAHTALRQYDAAIDLHRRFVEQHPDHPRAPDALRNVGNCQRDMGRWTWPRPLSAVTDQTLSGQLGRAESQAATEQDVSSKPWPIRCNAARPPGKLFLHEDIKTYRSAPSLG